MATTETIRRARLSWMWVFVMLNMIFADILSFMDREFLAQLMEGRAGQVTITPELLLAVAVVTEIPIAMVVLTQVLPWRVARWANIVAGALTIVYVIRGGSAAPHYIFIAGIETLACIVIAWSAWMGRDLGQRPSVQVALGPVD